MSFTDTTAQALAIKASFPIFKVHPELVYLDNAATTQKPQSVIEGITRFYREENANIHRGIYDLAAQTSEKYEAVREKVRALLNGRDRREIVYTSGTTAGINLVAQSFLAPKLEAGDEVLITEMEHHANLIPWQVLCRQKGAQLRIIPTNEKGEIKLDNFEHMLSARTKMVAVVHISNTLGTINPIADMINLAHKREIPVLIDGAQSTAHYPIDLQALDADFFVFSGHKIFGPTGIGVLYGKMEHLKLMSPYQFGGDMIKKVSFTETTFADPPQRFEAGTTNIAGVIGLGYAIDFLNTLDRLWVKAHLDHLKNEATRELSQIEGLQIFGQAKNKSAIVSFILNKIHPHDIATFLGQENIAIRAGHHCTQPLMDSKGLHGTARASFSVYNTLSDIEQLVAGIKTVKNFFG